MLSLYVPLKLDRPRKLKLTTLDMEEIYDSLNSTARLKEDVDCLKLLRLLAGLHWGAYGTVLWAGLRHEDQKIRDGGVDVAKKILDAYLRKGGDLVPVADAIREAMYRSGSLPKAIYDRLKSTRDGDEDEAKADRDEDPTPAESST
jgi:hypothetical protein